MNLNDVSDKKAVPFRGHVEKHGGHGSRQSGQSPGTHYDILRRPCLVSQEMVVLKRAGAALSPTSSFTSTF